MRCLAASVAGRDSPVLIDADMRKGYLHDVIKQKVEPGLSDLISGNVTLDDVIHPIEIENKTSNNLARLFFASSDSSINQLPEPFIFS